MTLLDEFTALITELDRREIPYATCGGLAMAVHGHVRATKDIDLMISEEDLDRAFEAARSRGYDIEGLPLNFKDQGMKIRRISRIDKEARVLITIDFILVTELMADVWEDRVLASWESGQAWVVSRKGLRKMKALAGRDQDLLDIKYLDSLEDEDDDES